MRVAEDGIVVIDSFLACDTFNIVCHARLRDNTALRVRNVLEYIRTSNRPFSWWVMPGDQPENLGETLQQEGLMAAESERAMVADLDDLRAEKSPEALRIERVVSPEQLKDFAGVNAANWNPPDQFVIEFYDRVAPVALRADCPLRFYVGYVNESAVATAEMTISDDAVGLYNIATLASQRRRGFGTAMTVRPLLDARRDGFKTAVLQAAPDAVSIYARAGFRPFGEIIEYKAATSRA